MKTVEELEAELETVTRERDEARDTIVALTTAKAEADLEIATLTTALDERDLEAERGLEQYDRLTRERDEARAEVEQLGLYIEELKRDLIMVDEKNGALGAEVDRLTDERDELLVRVANQNAELRATREAYIDAKWTNAYRRGAEAMREACAVLVSNEKRLWLRSELIADLRALPIPEEP